MIAMPEIRPNDIKFKEKRFVYFVQGCHEVYEVFFY